MSVYADVFTRKALFDFPTLLNQQAVWMQLRAAVWGWAVWQQIVFADNVGCATVCEKTYQALKESKLV